MIDHNIDVQSVFSWTPKVVSNHWFSRGADGRSVGRSVGRCTDTLLPNFLGWVDLLSYGAPKRAWSSVNNNI